MKEHPCPFQLMTFAEQPTNRFAFFFANSFPFCFLFAQVMAAEESCVSCRTPIHAARSGHLKCLQTFHRSLHAKWWDSLVTYWAAWQGHLDCLQFAHESGCSWHVYLTAAAASEGQLKCLMYAIDNGCEIHLDTTLTAARMGHLDCLSFAHRRGASWHSRTSFEAAERGRPECLKYALDNGCPTHPDALNVALRFEKSECVKILRNRLHLNRRNDMDGCHPLPTYPKLHQKRKRMREPATAQFWKNNTNNVNDWMRSGHKINTDDWMPSRYQMNMDEDLTAPPKFIDNWTPPNFDNFWKRSSKTEENLEDDEDLPHALTYIT